MIRCPSFTLDVFIPLLNHPIWSNLNNWILDINQDHESLEAKLHLLQFLSLLKQSQVCWEHPHFYPIFKRLILTLSKFISTKLLHFYKHRIPSQLILPSPHTASEADLLSHIYMLCTYLFLRNRVTQPDPSPDGETDVMDDETSEEMEDHSTLTNRKIPRDCLFFFCFRSSILHIPVSYYTNHPQCFSINSYTIRSTSSDTESVVLSNYVMRKRNPGTYVWYTVSIFILHPLTFISSLTPTLTHSNI